MPDNVKIIETGETKSLAITDDNGIDCIQDLLGNAGLKSTQIDGNSLYELTEYEYRWWADYIKGYKTTKREIKELANALDESGKYNPEEHQMTAEEYVRSSVMDVTCDMEHERGCAIDTLRGLET